MKGRPVRFRGHLLHPASTHVPIGALLLVPVWDVAVWLGAPAVLSAVAWWTLVAGLCGGVLAGCLGALDYVSLPEDDRVIRLANRHVVLVASALVGAGVGLALRSAGEPASLPAVLVGVAVAGLTIVGGWHGAEMVVGHGVGVRPDSS